MSKKKIILFGSIGIAKKCLEKIILRRDIEFLGACCVPLKDTWRKEDSVYEYCKKNNIPILNMDDIKALNPDIGFSIRFDKIIEKEIIELFNIGIFNTHGGILPEYRGVYSNINSIINNEEEYGVTLHYIDSGIDSGDIVDIKKIRIKKEDTGYSLYRKGENLCFEILFKNIDSILNETNKKISQSELMLDGRNSSTYTRIDTIKKKKIKLDKLKDDKSLRIIRAFDSPYHEPAYIEINNQKFFLRSSWGDKI